jgi:hypothetical protein
LKPQQDSKHKPGISEVVIVGTGTHTLSDEGHADDIVIVVEVGGRVVTWVVTDVERLLVTTVSVLVRVGELVHDDIVFDPKD